MPRDRHASPDELPAPGHAGVSGMTPDSPYEIRVLGPSTGTGPPGSRACKSSATAARRSFPAR